MGTESGHINTFMKNYEKLSAAADHELALNLGQDVLELLKTHIKDHLYFNDGVNFHLCQEPFDAYKNYTHLSHRELCHIPIIESDYISIYKYQLVFDDMVYKIPVSVMLYKVFTKHRINDQKLIIAQCEDHFKQKNLNVLYTMSSKFGVHLPYHTDAFEWRYHQALQLSQPEALEFIDGEKVNLVCNEGYRIIRTHMPHRVLIKKGEVDRIFLSVGP